MRKNENGRSMIEMLGVLAIIGVLSVGGIYGYTVAMRKYKANEIAQTASMLATLAHAKNAGEGGDIASAAAAGLESAPGGVALTTSKATCTTSAGAKSTTECTLVAIELNSTSDGDWANIKNAVCSIAPRVAGDSTTPAGRAGYFVCGCGATGDTACPS